MSSRIFIVSDYANPSPRGRSDKVDTRQRVFDFGGLQTIVIVPPDPDIVNLPRPENTIEAPYPGSKMYPIHGRSILSKIFRRFGIPDEYWRWIIPAVRKIATLRPDAKDVIITMSHPVSNHLIGYACKLLFKVKWMADFRDPWVPNVVSGHKWNRVQMLLEKMVAFNADKLIVYSGYQMAEDYFQRTYNMPVEKTIRYGYVGFDKQKTYRNWCGGSSPVLVYGGSFYPPYITPVPLLYGLRMYLGAHESPVQMHFYGMWLPEYSRLVQELNLQDHVYHSHYISHEEFIKKLRVAAAAMVIVPDMPSELSSVPSKVSDYIGVGVPILAISPRNSSLYSLVNSQGLGVAVEEKAVAEGIEQVLGMSFDGMIGVPDGFDREENETRIASLIQEWVLS